MSRRTHRKSKNGCADCKRRHIKCDETLPACVNCQTTERICSFLNQPLTPQLAPVYPSPAATSTAVESPVCLQSPSLQTSQQYVVNLDHIELLCHFYTETFKDFNAQRDSAQNPINTFRQYIPSAPYLLYEVLAISALHLSLLRPAQRDYYRNYASGLQTEALSIFNSTIPNINESNCVPSFIFSSMIGVHVLCDTMRYRNDDLDIFLDRLTHFFRLHRGVRIMANTSWDMLRQTELKQYLDVPERAAEVAGTGTECEILQQMLHEADIGQTSVEAYQLAIKHLQWAFNMDRCAQTLPESRQMLFAWTILVSPKYTDLLMQRRPEALIILAYYGVILLRHRDLWIVGDGGEFLIRSISKSLGTYWQRWLAWPNAEVDGMARPGHGAASAG